MTTQADIRAALDKLDPSNDDNWTASGKPAMKAVEELLGDTSVTRADVDKAAPDFTRPAEQYAPDGPAVSTPKLARRAVAALDAQFGSGGDRFTDEDAQVAQGDISAADFYTDWLKRNRPTDVHKRPYHMLSAVEKARIGVFMAVARG